MFTKIVLDYKQNLFPELTKVTEFEDITKGRMGAVLVDIQNDLIPLVRTTTKYTNPAQKFNLFHYDIMEKIGIKFNNALIEVYDNQYCTMGFHSDQALDLEDGSYIGIYSCYENHLNQTNPRKLIIKNKTTNKISEITMDHNSVILFQLSTNQQYLHKIILENNKSNQNNKWLGITFRLSKTFINPINNVLKLANEEESKNFYKLRSEENKSLNFQYPEINYTISMSDLLPVIK